MLTWIGGWGDGKKRGGENRATKNILREVCLPLSCSFLFESQNKKWEKLGEKLAHARGINVKEKEIVTETVVRHEHRNKKEGQSRDHIFFVVVVINNKECVFATMEEGSSGHCANVSAIASSFSLRSFSSSSSPSSSASSAGTISMCPTNPSGLR